MYFMIAFLYSEAKAKTIERLIKNNTYVHSVGFMWKSCQNLFFLLLIVASRLFMSEDNMRQNKVIVVLIKGKYQLSVDSLMLSQPPFCLADSSACGTCKATVNIYC